MTPEQLRQIEELYHAACERPGQEREAFLTDACGSDEELRQRVQALLTHDSTVPVQIPVVEEAGHPLSGPPSGGWPPGTILGAYQIRGRLGEGGMGDVYKANDTRLGREVAIKTAKQEFSGRFQREARAISSLNHPNICTLYDVGPDYLVMELIEGKPIAGPLPVEEAVRLATQIASAVRHAHQHGVIHRDLKPGNILVTRAGVKVLDFGLAKFDRLRDNAPEATLTEKGMILGTLRYMAPEQLKGLEADHRSDIFAFGVVFYELLTGRPPFVGQSQADLIASVLTSDVAPMASLQPGIPMQLDHLVRTCLVKDPGERYQAMHDVMLELQWMAASGSQPGEVRATAKRWRRREILAWSAAASMAAAGGFLYFRQTSATPPASHFPVRFEQPVPPSTFLWSDMPAVSPDGRSFAYSLGRFGPSPNLWLRRLDRMQAAALTGSQDAGDPFWSPDSRFIAYFFRDQLVTVDATGGTPLNLCQIPVSEGLSGGTWSPHGVILYGTMRGPIYRVQATGGESKPVLALDRARGETRIVVGQAEEGLLELDGPKQAEFVAVLFRVGPLEVNQGGGRFAPIVEQVGEVDPRLGEGRVDRERPTEPKHRRPFPAQAVRDIAHARGGLFALGLGVGSQLEEPMGVDEEPLAEQRPADLEHQVVIFLEPEFNHSLEGPDRRGLVADPKQGLA